VQFKPAIKGEEIKRRAIHGKKEDGEGVFSFTGRSGEVGIAAGSFWRGRSETVFGTPREKKFSSALGNRKLGTRCRAELADYRGEHGKLAPGDILYPRRKGDWGLEGESTPTPS